jgi:hypothetical protein
MYGGIEKLEEKKGGGRESGKYLSIGTYLFL